MGVLVTLRDTDDISYFKEFSMELLRITEPEEVIISSGYFWETDLYSDPFTYGYYFSQDEDSNGDKVIDLLAGKRVIIAGHMSSEYTDYDAMFGYLRDNLRSRLGQDNVTAYEHLSRKWHAKEMFFRKHINGEMHTVAGIVGSSNCTRPAFGDVNSYGNHEYGFNVEADTYIYDSSYDNVMGNVTRTYQRQDENGMHILRTSFQPRMNGGRTPIQLLDKMYDRLHDQLIDTNIFVEV